MLLPCLAAVFMTGAATAQTFVVDDTPGPGVDFDSIAGALNSVPPGAVLDVRPGTYSGFNVQSAVTIVGEPTGVIVSSPVTVSGGGINGITVLSRLDLGSGLAVTDVPTAVILDNLQFSGSLESRLLDVTRAADVRLARVSGVRFVISDSRVQANECDFSGLVRGDSGSNSGLLESGKNGVTIEGTSLVHLDHCSATGTRGQDCPNPGFCSQAAFSAGSGGHGVLLGPHAVLRAVRSTFRGALPGRDDSCGCLIGPGRQGNPIRVEGRAEFWDNTYRIENFSNPSTFDVRPGGSATTTTPLPSLRASNAGDPGDLVTLRYDSLPNSSRRILAGRIPEIVPLPGLTVGLLVSRNRVASLGASASEAGILNFTQPPWNKGVVFYAQTSRTLSNGTTELTNSIAIVAR